ncbi:hypothetical protein CFP56_008349 [Quercus suber]|uniref:Uncharacterized protein n=1 Tax=Quercus suber TaxID=58331 RepID=A0AAW0L5R6_QUESU
MSEDDSDHDLSDETVESIWEGDMFSMAKAVNILNSIEDIDDLTLFKVIEELVNPESRSAFILMTPDKRRGWMDWVQKHKQYI